MECYAMLGLFFTRAAVLTRRKGWGGGVRGEVAAEVPLEGGQCMVLVGFVGRRDN